MRRIYESDAITRDDERPFIPGRRPDDYEPQSFRFINSSAWSDWLLPHRVRCWAVTVSLSLPKRTFKRGETVPFRITMRNRFPIPVSVRTYSPVVWTWSVDGHDLASTVSDRDQPGEESKLRLNRGERIAFERHWDGYFKISDSEWIPAEPGEYELEVRINAIHGYDEQLSARETITITL